MSRHILYIFIFIEQNLQTHLKKFSKKYDQLVAFKPTGWTFNQTVGVEDIQPQTQGNISIYGECKSVIINLFIYSLHANVWKDLALVS